MQIVSPFLTYTTQITWTPQCAQLEAKPLPLLNHHLFFNKLVEFRGKVRLNQATLDGIQLRLNQLGLSCQLPSASADT